MKKRTTSERDWLLVSSRSITTSAIHSPPGPISGPIEVHHGTENLLRDYGDESAWSRRIEAEAQIYHLDGGVPFSDVDEE
jgi:hypothetical protein